MNRFLPLLLAVVLPALVLPAAAQRGLRDIPDPDPKVEL